MRLGHLQTKIIELSKRDQGISFPEAAKVCGDNGGISTSNRYPKTRAQIDKLVMLDLVKLIPDSMPFRYKYIGTKNG